MIVVLLIILLSLVITFGVWFFLNKLPKGETSNRFVSITVGHRGCRWIVPPNVDDKPDSIRIQTPENSVSSFDIARLQGCTAFELDCRLTADNHVVVIHDDLISRVCSVSELNNKKYISDMTLAEVKQLRYIDWNTTETIPTLEEVLTWAQSHSLKVFVELKSLTYTDSKKLSHQVADIFAKFKAWEFACIIAFHPVAVYFSRLYQPKTEVCILFCQDFFQWGCVSGLEKRRWWAPFAYLMDQVLLTISPTFIPKLTGCQLVGPDTRILTKSAIAYYQTTLNVGIYCWVANTFSDHDFFLNQGCSVGTDLIFPHPIDPNRVLNPMHKTNLIKYGRPTDANNFPHIKTAQAPAAI